LASLAPPKIQMLASNGTTFDSPLEKSPMELLYQWVASGYLPGPIKVQVLEKDEVSLIVNNEDTDYVAGDYDVSDGDEEQGISCASSNDDSDGADFESDDSDIDDRDLIVVKLLLGRPPSDDYYVFQTWHSRKQPIRRAKQKLAKMALEELLGEVAAEFDRDEDEEEYDEEDENMSVLLRRDRYSYYEWETKQAAEGNVESYLYGTICYVF